MARMKKFCSAFVFLLFFQISAYSQFMELGVLVGGSNYSGDLVPTLMPDRGNYHFALGVFGRYNFAPRFAVKAHFYAGKISGSDSNSAVSEETLMRNLSFRSKIYELGIQGELNILKFEPYRKDFAFTPYLFAGVSGFHFNPEAYYDRKWHKLKELGTEGQGLPGYEEQYKLYQVSIPAGVGFKIALNELAIIGFEMGIRKTFTDYLDDVSTQYPVLADLAEARGEEAQALSFRTPEVDKSTRVFEPDGMIRGNPEKKDWYMIGGFTISISLNEEGYF